MLENICISGGSGWCPRSIQEALCGPGRLVSFQRHRWVYKEPVPDLICDFSDSIAEKVTSGLWEKNQIQISLLG